VQPEPNLVGVGAVLDTCAASMGDDGRCRETRAPIRPAGGPDARPLGGLTQTIIVLHSRPCIMPDACWLPWLTPQQPWSTPSSRRELTMRPTSILFACACPLIREQAFPIAFLARPQLLTRP
jgi:hypothetical protein